MRMFALFALLLLISCTSPIKQDLERNRILGHTLSIDSLPEEKRITVYMYADEKGFLPDTINVKRDDYVRLIITNRVDTDISSFYIEGYHITEYYSYSGSIEIPLVANKAGTFTFGDDSRTKRKGTLFVSEDR